MEYLYPDVGDEAASTARYLGELSDLIQFARGRGADVTVIRPPLPSRFRKLLIGEAEFDEKLTSIAASDDASVLDLSGSMDDPRFYADTDHLNRAGVTEFLQQYLKGILVPDGL